MVVQSLFKRADYRLALLRVQLRQLLQTWKTV
ncbi:hypothetical protein HY17_00180 [Hyphomonas sp. CY54-11-8]|nr:hypothetical protein HY17_00180 [Hyphomonas sp. CY54-11-8]